MTEKVKKALFESLKAIVSAIAGFLLAMLSTSCGSTTKAFIRNGAQGTSTSVTITTNNPTDWTVNPNTSVDFQK